MFLKYEERDWYFHNLMSKHILATAGDLGRDEIKTNCVFIRLLIKASTYHENCFLFCWISYFETQYLSFRISWEWNVLFRRELQYVWKWKKQDGLVSCFFKKMNSLLVISYKCHEHDSLHCRKHIEAWLLYILAIELESSHLLSFIFQNLNLPIQLAKTFESKVISSGLLNLK